MEKELYERCTRSIKELPLGMKFVYFRNKIGIECREMEWASEDIAVCTLNPALTATGFFDAQPNPAGLAHPDLSGATRAEDVAQHVLKLDRHPQPERSLRWKWRLLGVLSVLAPRLADRMLVKRLGGSWRAPKR